MGTQRIHTSLYFAGITIDVIVLFGANHDQCIQTTVKSPVSVQVLGSYYSQNEISSPIAANFVPHCFGLNFHVYVIFLLINISQLDNDV